MESQPQNPEFRNNPEHFHVHVSMQVTTFGPCCEKTCLRGFRQSEFQTSLLSDSD